MPCATRTLCDDLFRELSLSNFPKLPATDGKLITPNGGTHQTETQKWEMKNDGLGREVRE